jgi:NADH:ubiquinone reductase (H+-translocating)
MKGKLAGAAGVIAALVAYRRRRAPAALLGEYASAGTKVLVMGGGFGGLAAARELARLLGGHRDVGVALLDRVNYTTFWPMVPSAISSDVEVRHAVHSLRRILRPLGVEFYGDEVEGVDFEARRLQTAGGTFPYDYLILAPGSETAFFGTPGAEQYALDLKGVRNVLRVRNRVIDRFEEAERLSGEAPEGLLTFVFVGAGATGVEAAAETHDLIFDVLRDDYPNVDFDEVRVVLVNADSDILGGVDSSLVHAARRRLAAQRIEIVNDAKVTEVRPGAVALSDGLTIPARTVVWAAGIEPSALVRDLDLAKDHRGHILVDEFLRAKERRGVYAVGDCISIDYDGPPVPALAQGAEQEGKRAARNLAAEMEGGAPEPFRYRPLGQLVDLGEGSSLVDILGARFSGRLGALAWKGVYLYEIGYNLNRAQVLSDWAIELFTRPDTAKLFEESGVPVDDDSRR